MSEFTIVFLLCPLMVLAASVIGHAVFHKWAVMPTAVFVVFTILTFTVFNSSFFIWVMVYTVLSIIVSLLMNRRKGNPAY
ncbi:UNVERIFIED_CONTAM: DUF2651 family protein [Halobacillus marinus]|uniref:DUF2651 family protein n=1 Tax=Bacillaceae TaxID=186817 RepID=UPI0002A4F197|nr:MULTISPECIES: DUF2651 family protein [Bacillaceae]ELK44349.1 hypothetical protein D479_19483 [Halobacillus sp. BAB-2008]QHT46333.1 DUF2651 domain-containing protein [Bacillus sp. SB49]